MMTRMDEFVEFVIADTGKRLDSDSRRVYCDDYKEVKP